MFRRNAKLKEDINEIKRALIGFESCGDSFDSPSRFAALGRVAGVEKTLERHAIIMMSLLDNLGFTLEEGPSLVKKKRKR